MVVLSIALLLSVTLFMVFHYSRKTVKTEALHKAGQALNATVQQIDNVLLSVEQSSGNIYADLCRHLSQADRMPLYCQELVETNPHICGSTIAFVPDYRQQVCSYHRSSSDISQPWFKKTIDAGTPCWVNPQKTDHGAQPVITFCLPIYDGHPQPVGVMAVDVSLALLSDIVLAVKPSPNSYAMLLAADGSFVVHPDSIKLQHETVYTLRQHGSDTTVAEAASDMMAGNTDYRHVVLDGTDCYVFYKPFHQANVPGRALGDLHWSVGVVYPEDDIFGDYKRLLYIVLFVAIAGLLLLYLLCKAITHRQLLPLRMLSTSAQRIAEGHYDEPIPESRQIDEVGQLQDNFQQMQQALATHIGELQRLTDTLHKQGKGLAEAYDHAQEADRMKTAFLHHMTDQMMTPVADVCTSATALCEQCLQPDTAPYDADLLADHIQEQGNIVTELLNDLLVDSQRL